MKPAVVSPKAQHGGCRVAVQLVDEGVDAPQAQLGDEAVLQSLPEAFDPAFGLRGAGGVFRPRQITELLNISEVRCAWRPGGSR
jgi:hypothetical protein